MFTNSNIQVSHAVTITEFIAESKLKLANDIRRKLFWNAIFEIKVFT